MEQKLNKLRSYEKTLKIISRCGKFPVWAVFAFFVASLISKLVYNGLYITGIIGYITFVIILNIIVAISFSGLKKGYLLCCEKLKNIQKNICEIEKNNSLNNQNESIATRFNSLSRNNQLKLLDFIKGDSYIKEILEGFKTLSEEEKILLQSQLNIALKQKTKQKMWYSDSKEVG